MVWQIISEKGEAKDSHIFESSVETFPGWERYYIMTYYSDYLERMDDLEVIKKGADFYASISLDESAGWLAFFQPVIYPVSVVFIVKIWMHRMKLHKLYGQKPSLILMDY